MSQRFAARFCGPELRTLLLLQPNPRSFYYRHPPKLNRRWYYRHIDRYYQKRLLRKKLQRKPSFLTRSLLTVDCPLFFPSSASSAQSSSSSSSSSSHNHNLPFEDRTDRPTRKSSLRNVRENSLAFRNRHHLTANSDLFYDHWRPTS